METYSFRRGVEVRIVAERSGREGRQITVEPKPVRPESLEAAIGRAGGVVCCKALAITEGTHFTEREPTSYPEPLRMYCEGRIIETAYAVRAVGREYELIRHDRQL
jgi:hypothetical protein